jgi:hypothetical protein
VPLKKSYIFHTFNIFSEALSEAEFARAQKAFIKDHNLT